MIASEKNISILGCGWYGLPLAKKLITEGYSVKGSTTTPAKITSLQQSGIIPYLVNFEENEESFDPDFFDCSVLIISIPPKRSAAQQHTFLSKIQKIAKAANHSGVPQIIFISSTSVYGDRNSKVTESTPATPDTASGEAILAAEIMLKECVAFTTTIVRFGGLIGPERNPGRFFAGKKDIPNGQAPVNLIHLTDCIGITLSIIERQAYGYIYNACSTAHPSRAEFYTKAALTSGLEKPEFIDELQSWKLIESINIPSQLDYTFQFSINDVELQ